MYAFIGGKLASKTPTAVVVENNGIGYLLHISLYTYQQIESLDEVRLWTQLIVKEDSHTLYGFIDEIERLLFNQLISVSGIGPNTARLILSAMTPQETQNAIMSEDLVAFKKVKGVGPKTAKRLMVELKDKIMKTASKEAVLIPGKTSNSSKEEALIALTTLGYQRNQALQVIQKITQSGASPENTEEWIRAALKELAG